MWYLSFWVWLTSLRIHFPGFSHIAANDNYWPCHHNHGHIVISSTCRDHFLGDYTQSWYASSYPSAPCQHFLTVPLWLTIWVEVLSLCGLDWYTSDDWWCLMLSHAPCPSFWGVFSRDCRASLHWLQFTFRYFCSHQGRLQGHWVLPPLEAHSCLPLIPGTTQLLLFFVSFSGPSPL